MTSTLATGIDIEEVDPPPSNHALIGSEPVPATFTQAYDEHVDMVWRGLRGLGVGEANVEDAVQDVFLVVHRRMSEFEGRSTFKTWLFGIVLRVARNYRRQSKRKEAREAFDTTPELCDEAPLPDEELATAQALRHLVRLLSGLDESKREVFVLSELQQMSAPEIAETLSVNVNTVYSRLRAARQAFDGIVVRDNLARESAVRNTKGGRP